MRVVHWVMSGLMSLETMKKATTVSCVVVGRCGEKGGCFFDFHMWVCGSWGDGKKRSFAMMRVGWLRKSRSILPLARALVVVDVELGTRPWGWR